MTIGCNIWMICLELNLLFYDPKLNVATFWICMDATFFSISGFNSFLLIGETDRSKISSDQKRLFFAVSLYPLLFFANTPFNDVQEATWVLDILDTKYIPSSPIGCKNWKSWFLSGVIVNAIAAKSISFLKKSSSFNIQDFLVAEWLFSINNISF